MNMQWNVIVILKRILSVKNNIHLVRLLLDCDYVIPTGGEEEEEVSAEVAQKQAKGKSSKVFALGRKLQKLPSITKQYVKDQLTGKASQITIVNGKWRVLTVLGLSTVALKMNQCFF